MFQAVIPCGGLATRLGNLTKETPKSMIDICGKPFLEYQIELLQKQGIKDILLCISHLGNQIEYYFGNGSRFGINIDYSVDNQMGVIGAVKNAEDMLEKDFFIMYGDSYLPHLNFEDLFIRYIAQDKPAMLTVWKNDDYIDKSNIKIINGNIINVDCVDADYIDYGVTVLNRKVIEGLPKNIPLSTKDLRARLFERGQMGYYQVNKRFYHIGTLDALEETKEYIIGRMK